MEKEVVKNEFPAVEVAKGFLGLKKGSVLKFDRPSSKYITVSQFTDHQAHTQFGEDSYYYSGYAIALDPVVVKENIGKFFKYYEKAEQAESKDLPETKSFEEPLESKVEDKETGEAEFEKDVEAKLQGLLKEDVSVATLSFECGLCHFENEIAIVKSGLFFPVSEKTKLDLVCSNCGISTKVFYRF